MSTSAVQRARGWGGRRSGSQRPEGRAFIAGRLVPARAGRLFDDVSPIDGQTICQVARCGPEDVGLAVATARDAFEQGSGRRMEPRERKRILRPLAEAIRADVAHLALLETRDVGKAIGNSVGV